MATEGQRLFAIVPEQAPDQSQSALHSEKYLENEVELVRHNGGDEKSEWAFLNHSFFFPLCSISLP